MFIPKENLYHPFKGSLLGTLHKETLATKNITGFALEDIDLYYQPVPDPTIATIFSFIMILLCFIGEYLYYKVFVMLRKESSIIKNISTVFITAILLNQHISIFLIISTNFVHPLNELIGQWFCTVMRFVIYFSLNIVFFHSFIAAFTRYCFIVHSAKVELYGKEKLKKLLLSLSILIPLSVTLWKLNDGADLDGMSFINKCQGKHHDSFLVETSTLNVFKKNFCEFRGNDVSSVYDQIVSTFKQICCVASMATMLIMGSNVTEGIIYYRLFSHIQR